jgi:hypothetical protein
MLKTVRSCRYSSSGIIGRRDTAAVKRFHNNNSSREFLDGVVARNGRHLTAAAQRHFYPSPTLLPRTPTLSIRLLHYCVPRYRQNGYQPPFLRVGYRYNGSIGRRCFSSSNSRGPIAPSWPTTTTTLPPQPPPRIPPLRVRLRRYQNAKRRSVAAVYHYYGEEEDGNNGDFDGSGVDVVHVSPVYVHPLSRAVLQRLQDCHHDWIQRYHLDERLFIHPRYGTFLIESNHAHYQSVVRLWTYYCPIESSHYLAMSTQNVRHRVLLLRDGDHDSSSTTTMVWNNHENNHHPQYCPYVSIEERVKHGVRELMNSVDELILR